MTYTKNLAEIVKARQQREEMAQKNALEASKIAEKKALDQQNTLLNQERLNIDANKVEADIRKSDKQSQEIEAKTITELLNQEQGGERKPAGKADPNKAVADLDKTPPTPDQIKKDESMVAPPTDEEPPVPSSAGVPSPSSDPGVQPPSLPKTVPVKPSKEYQKMLEGHLSYLGDMYHKKQARTLQKQQAEADKSMKERQEIFKKIVTAHDKAIVSIDKMRNNLKTLRDNPPLRNQILKNTHWGLKVASAIHAGIQGYLVTMGARDKVIDVLQQMVDREYQDQINEWESNKGALSDEMNLLQWNYSATNDMLSAQLGMRGQLWDMVNDNYENQLKGLERENLSREKQLEIGGMLEAIKQNSAKSWNEAQQQAFENKLSLFKETKKGSNISDVLKIRKDAREQAKFEGKHFYRYKTPKGNYKDYVLSDKRKAKIDETAAGSNKAVLTANDIQNVSRELRLRDIPSSWFASVAGFFGFKGPKEAQRKFKALAVLLTQYKMNIRKDVAGGQVAVAEHRMMDDLLNNIPLDGSFFGTPKFNYVMNKLKGNYDTIALMLKRRAVAGVVSELMESKIGADYRKKYGAKGAARRLFIETGRKMGLKRGELSFKININS